MRHIRFHLSLVACCLLGTTALVPDKLAAGFKTALSVLGQSKGATAH